MNEKPTDQIDDEDGDFILGPTEDDPPSNLRLHKVSTSILLIGLTVALFVGGLVWSFCINSLPVEAPADAFSGWTAKWLTAKTYPIQAVGSVALMLSSFACGYFYVKRMNQ